MRFYQASGIQPDDVRQSFGRTKFVWYVNQRFQPFRVTCTDYLGIIGCIKVESGVHGYWSSRTVIAGPAYIGPLTGKIVAPLPLMGPQCIGSIPKPDRKK